MPTSTALTVNGCGPVSAYTITGNGTVSALFAAGYAIGLSAGLLAGLGTLGGLLSALVLLSLARPTPRLNFALYKGASIYMLASMLLLIAGGW